MNSRLCKIEQDAFPFACVVLVGGSLFLLDTVGVGMLSGHDQLLIPKWTRGIRLLRGDG